MDQREINFGVRIETMTKYSSEETSADIKEPGTVKKLKEKNRGKLSLYPAELGEGLADVQRKQSRQNDQYNIQKRPERFTNL